MAYLDETGLSSVWGKVKSLVQNSSSSGSSGGFASFEQLYFNSAGTTGTVTLSDTAKLVLIITNYGVTTAILPIVSSYWRSSGGASYPIGRYGISVTMTKTSTTLKTNLNARGMLLSGDSAQATNDTDAPSIIIYAVYKMA